MQEFQVRNRMTPIPKQRRRFLFEDWCQEAARRLRADHVLQLQRGDSGMKKKLSVYRREE